MSLNNRRNLHSDPCEQGRQLHSDRWIALNKQRPLATELSIRHSGDSDRLNVKASRKVEAGTFSFNAIKPDLPTHHLDQMDADRQSQPGSSETTGRRIIRLRKRLKNSFLPRNRDTNTGIPNGKA